MAESYFPFDAGAGANAIESQWRLMAQHWVTGGSGVLATELNGLAAFGDSTGLQVKVPTGRAWVRGHFYENDAQRTLAISANSSGNPRIDRVVVRLDATANTITALVITGTPAGSPTAPAITMTSTVWDVPLAQVAVANGAATITAGNVTDERPLIGPLLGALRVPSATVRDLVIPTPVAGMVIERGDRANRFEIYDGSAWAEQALCDVQIFTSSGTWTKPTFGSVTHVTAIGGGGGGGSGRQGASGTNRGGGGGGQGGGRAVGSFRTASLGSTETVTVGTGGAGGTAVTSSNVDGNAGSAGGDSTFGSWLRAKGGAAGTQGTASSGTGGQLTGAGGTGGNGGASGVVSPGGGGQDFPWNGGSGGGGGGGITSSDVTQTGGTGGHRPGPGTGGGAANGGAGSAVTAGEPIGGGGGGGGNGGATGGGAGAIYGGGGGGGGAAQNTFNVAGGGAGANGIVVAVTVP